MEPELAEGIELFNQGRFFDCHEVLEKIWMIEGDPQKKFYQGIIMVAMAFYRFEKKVYSGAAELLKLRRQPLEKFRPSYFGVDVEKMLEETDPWLLIFEEAKSGRKIELLPLSPKIRIKA